MTNGERIQASVDPETKRTLEQAAKREKISVSALLRIVARRIREGEAISVRPGRRDDRGFAAIVGLLVLVVVVVVVVGFIIMGLSLSAVQPGASCVLKGTTTPVSVTVTLRKGTIDASGNMARTIVASTTSSPLDGRYSVSTTCGGYFDAVASKTGYDSSMRQTLPFNAGPTTETVDWILSPTVG